MATNGNDRLDRVERILEEVAKTQHEMAARQQYHDEALERHDERMREHDGRMKALREAIEIDAENIRALVHIVERHEQRLDDLEGDEPA